LFYHKFERINRGSLHRLLVLQEVWLHLRLQCIIVKGGGEAANLLFLTRWSSPWLLRDVSSLTVVGNISAIGLRLWNSDRHRMHCVQCKTVKDRVNNTIIQGKYLRIEA